MHQTVAQLQKGRKMLPIFVVLYGITASIWLFWEVNKSENLQSEKLLTEFCDAQAQMLEDEFYLSKNYVHALANLVSLYYQEKNPSVIDQKKFSVYTERTAFERHDRGVAYALKVPHSERELFEKQRGWTIKKMGTEGQTLFQNCIPQKLDPAPIHDEYAPVIFYQETVSHIVSIDMMSGKEDRENILRARTTGKGVLTSPFKLLKSNHIGFALTFAVYNTDLPPDATPEQRIEATVGYLVASYDVPSLMEKLLHLLAIKKLIVVNVYDTTNASSPVTMYGTEVSDTGFLQTCNLDFGDPQRKHEIHCRFKQKPSLPWTAISTSTANLIIYLLIGYIIYASINRIDEVKEVFQLLEKLTRQAKASDVAKSQFITTVSNKIRSPMKDLLGILHMLMDTDLDANQLDHVHTAYASWKDLIGLIDVLDMAKIESGRVELETLPFDLRSFLKKNFLLLSGESNKKEE